MSLDQALASRYPRLDSRERRFVRYQGAMLKAWGTNRYHRLSYMFAMEFPAGELSVALMHRIADILLGKEPTTC